MKRLLVLSAAVGALAVAPSASASPARSASDIVIAKTTGGVLVANPAGTVSFVHARARVGSRVVKLGSRLWVVGLTHSARFRGIVVAHRGNLLVLSAAQHLFTVDLAGRKLASASGLPGSGPQAGDVVGVVASIDASGNITATSTEDDGSAGTSQVRATITSVGTGTVTLDVNGESVTLQLPPGITVPTTSVGNQVTLTLTFSAGTTTASEDDQGENQSSTQGSGGDNGGSQSSSSGEDDNGGSSTTGSTSGGSTNTGGDDGGGSGSGAGGGDD